MTKSDNQPKHLLQKWTLPIKTINDQNENFEETDFGKKTDKANEAEIILQTQFTQNFCRKKTNQF